MKDGLIHKEEFQFALFRNSNRKNLFADRVFDLFNIKRNGAIDFGAFLRSLSIFHPNAPQSEKIACTEFFYLMLHLYCLLQVSNYYEDLFILRQTGYIERHELKEMVVALLNESDLYLSDDMVETIVSKIQMVMDGWIDPDEWRDFVKRNPYLKDISMAFPSFIVDDLGMIEQDTDA